MKVSHSPQLLYLHAPLVAVAEHIHVYMCVIITNEHINVIYTLQRTEMSAVAIKEK